MPSPNEEQPSADEWDGPESLLQLLQGLPDPRKDHNKCHRLVDILAIAILGALCSVDNYVELERFARIKEKWLRTFLQLPAGIPSHDTIGRVFAALEPQAFLELFVRWVQSWREPLGLEHVAIDGKAIRAALARSQRSSPLMILSAFAVESGLVLGQVQTEDKSNEIEAVPRLLETLRLKGKLVTLDALHCQSETVKKLHGCGAHYCIAVKDNQAGLRKAIDDHMRPKCSQLRAEPQTDRMLETVEKGHGRIETRRYFISDELDALELREMKDSLRWPGVNVIGCVERERTVLATGKSSYERTMYIASLPRPDVELFAKAVRGHWAIETSLHWVLDMAFDEDRCTVRTKHASQNYAMIRKFALNLLRQDRTNKVGIQCKRKMCGWDHAYLFGILTGKFSHDS